MELFNVGSCTEGLFNFTQKNDSFNILRGLKVSNILNKAFFHIGRQGVQVFSTVHINVSDLVQNFRLTEFERDFIEERSDIFSGDVHIFMINLLNRLIIKCRKKINKKIFIINCGIK